MEEQEIDVAPVERTPVHLWIVGGLALIWNAFGGYDYLMSRTHNAAYIKSMMPDADTASMFAYLDAMPLYANIGWGLGVWAGVAGAILLLLRSRFAVHAFAASLIGMALSFAYQLFVTPPPPEMDSKLMSLAIVLVGVLLLWYALRQRSTGVLR
jgi:hypothetical protein